MMFQYFNYGWYQTKLPHLWRSNYCIAIKGVTSCAMDHVIRFPRPCECSNSSYLGPLL